MYDFEVAKKRNQLYKNIRSFFDDRDYLEVDTPTLSDNLIPESSIESFATMFSNEFLRSKEFYMIPSPEVFMKKLFTQKDCPSIYQISKCFRNAEQLGRIHNPEFTMLEYYTKNFTEKDSIKLTKKLFDSIELEGCSEALKKDFEIITMREACKRWANVDLDELQDPNKLRAAAVKLKLLEKGIKESWADTFNRIFLTLVETNLPKDHPVVITDYPKQIDCLAQNEGNYKRRWELYVEGTEVANCYWEENNPDKVKNYYEKERAIIYQERGDSNRVIPDFDEEYFKNFIGNYPSSSGVAIGLDRLLMLECNKHSFKGVILFPFSDMINEKKNIKI